MRCITRQQFNESFGISFIVFLLMKHTTGLRVTKEEERQGLDLSEHGESAYAEFLVGNEEE